MENQKTPEQEATTFEVIEFATSILHLIIAASRYHPPVGDVHVTKLNEHLPGKAESAMSGKLEFDKSSGQFYINIGGDAYQLSFSSHNILRVLPQSKIVYIETMAFAKIGGKSQLIRICNK